MSKDAFGGKHCIWGCVSAGVVHEVVWGTLQWIFALVHVNDLLSRGTDDKARLHIISREVSSVACVKSKFTMQLLPPTLSVVLQGICLFCLE